MPPHFVNGGQQMSCRQVVLRLDDGSLVGHSQLLQDGKSSGAVLLTPDQAFNAGRVQEADVHRLRTILQKLDAYEPPAAPVRSLSTANVGQKRKPHETVEDEFVDKCCGMVDEVRRSLGPSAPIFDRPVDGRLVTDYYNVVKKPMDLGTLKQRLLAGHYSTPQQFAEDMRQIWVNCHLYNKKETPIDRAGRQAEQLFQEKWNRSGFAAADARARRNNAGVAAPKFEPNEYGPPEKKLQRRSSGSKNGRTSVKKNGLDHGYAAPMPKNPVTFDRQKEMAQLLSSMDGDELDGAIKLIKEDESMAEAGGEEMELDFDVLSPLTIAKLDRYLRRVRPEGSRMDNGEESSDNESSDED
ncbi:hypothetical protein MMC08_007691 [Hypocenomyce scalaris]|nr:hypothetical protein [Hypocenomyce scalaris]